MFFSIKSLDGLNTPCKETFINYLTSAVMVFITSVLVHVNTKTSPSVYLLSPPSTVQRIIKTCKEDIITNTGRKQSDGFN